MNRKTFFLFVVFLLALLTDMNLILAEEGKLKEVKMDKNIYFAYRSFWPEHETMKKFSAQGVNTFCLFPGNTMNSLGEPYSKYPSIWRYPKVYDWKSLNQQFDDVIALNPKAEFICMVDLNTPQWLERMIGQQGDGSYDSFENLSNCMLHPLWQKHTQEYLNDFIQYMEEHYGDRVRAYVLACGQTDEWMDYYGGHFGRYRTSAFRKWQEKKGFPLLQNPIPFSSFDTATFENFLRDPSKEAPVIQAIQFQHDTMVNTITQFAKKTKQLTKNKKEVGIFFGYIMELTGWRMVGCGHLCYERIYACPDIDFFISPGTYGDRPIGGGSGFMAVNATRLRFGKGYMHEVDHRTTTYNCALNEYVKIQWMNSWKSEAEDLAGVRREFCLALIHHSSVWWFDMWGGVWKTDEAINNIGTMKKIWDRFSSDRTVNAAEVLLVVDPLSTSLVNDRGANTSANTVELHMALRNKLNRLGAPFEVCSFSDLESMDLEQYKFIVFSDLFVITPDRATLLKDKILKKNRTILWLYAPGINNGINLDNARIQQWTGTPYSTKGINQKKQEAWTSVYIHQYKDVSIAVLRQLAKQSGVTIYCDEEVPVYANGHLVAVHVKNGGKKTIHLPQSCKKITELFSGKVVAQNTKEFNYEFASPETALFEMER